MNNLARFCGVGTMREYLVESEFEDGYEDEEYSQISDEFVSYEKCKKQTKRHRIDELLAKKELKKQLKNSSTDYNDYYDDDIFSDFYEDDF